MESPDIIFVGLKRIPFTKYPELVDLPYSSILPKSRRILMRNFYRDIFSISEPRLLVITGHLYLDYILEKMLEKANLVLSEKQKQSFSIKMNKLGENNMFDTETFISLGEINKLRNSLAHNIFYEISDWDPCKLPYAAKHGIRIPKRKDLLKAFNITYLRMSFFAMISALSNQHSWLYLEDNPKR